MEVPSRVDFTEDAAALLRKLRDGSSPMCYPAGEFRTGGQDVLLQTLHVDGIAEPIDFWMSASQFEYWKHTHLTVDVVDG